MEGAGFRSLIIFLLLAILAFVAGSLASEDAQNALIPVSLILGLFFLIYLGKNCWVLVFSVPPLLSAFNLGIFQNFPISFFICGVVLIYMIALSMMGYIKLKWQSHLPMDIISAILVIYCLSTWVRHPVTIKAFTSITDYGYAEIGGREYFWCIGAVFSYLGVSVVNLKLETLIKMLKWVFLLSFGVAFFNTLKGLFIGGYHIGNEVATTRFGMFVGVSLQVFQYLLARYPLSNILFSPWKLSMVVFSTAGLLVAGFRTTIITSSLYALVAAFFQRQLVILLLLGMAVWGALVYLSHEEMLEDLPHGIKRALTLVPGVEIKDKAIIKGAEHSSEWRLEMWKWALNPSKGYIKDYVWGDGFGMSEYREHLRRVSQGLGLVKSGDNTLYAARGVWHNAAITVLQEMGGVGLGLAVVWFLIVLTCFSRIGLALKHTPGKEFIYMQLIPIYSIFITFFFLVGGTIDIFASYYHAAIGKLVYVKLVQENKLTSLFVRKEYRPLIMQE